MTQTSLSDLVIGMLAVSEFFNACANLAGVIEPSSLFSTLIVCVPLWPQV